MALAQSPQQSRQRSGAPYTILGLVLAVLGFGAVIMFANLTGGHGGPAASGTQIDVVVAAKDIGIRSQLASSDLKLQKFVQADAPPGYFGRIDEAKNQIAALDIKTGQPLTSNMLVKSPDAVQAPQTSYLPIPSGFVAVTIPTGEQQGVAGYIQTGDYISIVTFVGGANSQNVRTLFTNVHVIKVGPASADPAASRNSGVSSSLTIVMTQCQAEYLNWFIANATLKYTLESYKDYKPQDTGVDATCPSVNSATGVTRANIAQRWPGIFG